MDLTAATTSLLTALVAIPATAWLMLRKVKKDIDSDKAEHSAVEWHEKVIKRQDLEAERLRAQIESLREQGTTMHRRLLEVELREKVKEKIIKDLVRDIRLVKREDMPLDALNTGLIDDL